MGEGETGERGSSRGKACALLPIFPRGEGPFLAPKGRVEGFDVPTFPVDSIQYAEQGAGSVEGLVETLLQHSEGQPRIGRISGIPTLQGIFVKRTGTSPDFAASE